MRSSVLRQIPVPFEVIYVIGPFKMGSFMRITMGSFMRINRKMSYNWKMS